MPKKRDSKDNQETIPFDDVMRRILQAKPQPKKGKSQKKPKLKKR